MGVNLEISPPTHSWLTDELDRPTLARCRMLFEGQHAQRLNDAKQRLPATARNVLNALPVLLHLNHPSMPGYSGHQIPRGIMGYHPEPGALRAVRQFAKGFTAPKRLPAAQLNGLYFMGSAGSVAHTRSSDIDIWVCLPSGLHAAIASKLTKLARWAQGLGVELQCFTVDPQQFVGGTTQAFSPLLLDEFYRTGCRMAGQYPIWWLVPTDAAAWHTDIAARLLEQKYVNPQACLDFGTVGTFRVDELFAAGVRELERSLRTPHKSLMKLALLESYADGYPPLSDRYKAAVLNGGRAEELDSYVMLADHLDDYFGQRPKFSHRRAFMQRAWLTKTGRGNARLAKNISWWQRALRWGFDHQAADRLRWPNNWPLSEVIAEHHRCMAEFAHALSFLGNLERHARARLGTDELRDVELLSARLADMRQLLLQHTQYNDKLLHAVVPDQHRGQAEVIQSPSGDWCLCEDQRTLIQRPRLAQVFLWLKRQGLNLNSLRAASADLTPHKQIFAALTHEPYVVLVNAEADPSDAESAVITEADDPLSYGVQQHCLIEQVDLVHTPRSGHSEAQFWTYLPDALCRLLTHPDAAVVAIGDIRRERIQHCIKTLLTEANAALNQPHSNYVFQLGDRVCCLHRAADGSLAASVHEDAVACFTQAPAGLTSLAGRGRLASVQSPAVFSLLTQPALLVINAQGSIHLHYRDQRLHRALHPPNRRSEEFIQSLSLFHALAKRRGVEVPRLYQLTPPGQVNAVMCNSVDQRLRYRLCFRHTAEGWTVQCGQELLRHRKLDHKLLRLVRQHVLAHRASGEAYPIYLNDLEWPGHGYFDSLRLKFALEAGLSANRTADAIQALQTIGEIR